MPSQSRSHQSYVPSRSRKPSAKTTEFVDRLGTFLLILALVVSGAILVGWVIEIVGQR